MGCISSKPAAPSKATTSELVQVASEKPLATATAAVPPPLPPPQSSKSPVPTESPPEKPPKPASATSGSQEQEPAVIVAAAPEAEAEDVAAVEDQVLPQDDNVAEKEEPVAEEELVKPNEIVEEPPIIALPPPSSPPKEKEEEPAVLAEEEPSPSVAVQEEEVVAPASPPPPESEAAVEKEPIALVGVVAEDKPETGAPAEAGEVEPSHELTMGEKLRRENAVIYPSAAAALASKGLQKYVPELEKRGIVSYKDLTTFEEDLSDPFWSQMPPFPDRKKMKTIREEACIAFGIEEGTISSAEQAAAALVPADDQQQATAAEEEEDESIYVPVREKTKEPCDSYELDVYGKEFNSCTCGHAKTAHKAYMMESNKTPSFATRQSSRMLSETTPATPLAEPLEEGKACNAFRLDLAASTPVCVTCAMPKMAHTNGSATTPGNNFDSPAGSNRFKEMNKGSFKLKN